MLLFHVEQTSLLSLKFPNLPLRSLVNLWSTMQKVTFEANLESSSKSTSSATVMGEGRTVILQALSKASRSPTFLTSYFFVLIVCLVGSLFGGFACRARRWNVTPDPGEVSDDSSTQYRPSLVNFYIRRLWGGEGGVSKSKNNKVQNTCIHDSSAHLDNLF